MRRRVLLKSMSAIAVVLCCQTGLAEAAWRRGRPATPPPLVTGDSDPGRYSEPYIDLEEWRDVTGQSARPDEYTTQSLDPEAYRVRHLYVHGGFKGTDAKFSFCFPPPEQYKGRFYQQTHPTIASEDARPRNIAMAVASGAYCVQTNMGGSEQARTAEHQVRPGYSNHPGSYIVNAEAAKFSRVVAERVYGRKHRPYGYLFGGSGGAYQVTASAQNTVGVWDGFLPYVMGIPGITTAHFLVRAHALRVLADKWPSVIDAFEPGGSGNPYVGLNAEQRLALEEATLYGFPPRAWFNYVPKGIGPLALVAAFVPLLDPTYLTDFWTKPGYIHPVSSVRDLRVDFTAEVVRVIERAPDSARRGPDRQLVLSNVPVGADLNFTEMSGVTGAAMGKSVPLGFVEGNTVSFGRAAPPELANLFQAGDIVRIQNSDYLALQTYYRHALPEYGSVWDFPPIFGSFRYPDGSPKYVQREVNVSIGEGMGDVGTTPGKISGKMIVLENLMDGDALPAEAGWYDTKVQAAMGAKYNDVYRIYYMDNAEHVQPTTALQETHVVNYAGGLDQALRDLSAWAERDVTPPPSTNYAISKGQVIVPPDAASRRGVQPVVDLTANGGIVARVQVGQPVAFRAKIELPPNTGSVVAADWDFEGTGLYAEPARLGSTKAASAVLTATHRFTKPGTYFPAIRVGSHRQGDATTEFARVLNLDRVRVIVTQ